jgi:tellurite methyltransferase
MIYDETYSRIENVFGQEPELILKNFYQRMDKSIPVLDIGAGQGRNSFFLARKGFTVDAIDPLKVAVETVAALADKDKLLVRTYHSSLDNLIVPTNIYSGILIFGLIQILSWKSIELLLEKIKNWTKEGSLLFVTEFSTADPSFNKISQAWNKIGKNSFVDEHSNIRTFLEEGEILGLFKGYEVLHHFEGKGSPHKHGDAPLEQHAMIAVVLQRK